MDKEMWIEQVIVESLGYYGHDQQILKTMEELCELGAELMHFRDGKATGDVVAGELADVFIMCEQMRLVLGAELVDAKVLEKLKRLEGMMEEGEDLRKERALKSDVDEILSVLIKTPKDIDRFSLVGKVGRVCAEYEAHLVKDMMGDRRRKLEEMRHESR